MIASISNISFLLINAYYFGSVHSFSVKQKKVRLLPSEIKCMDLTQSYSITLLNKLFSSVPKRDYAIQDITLSFGQQGIYPITSTNNFCLLVGRSGCGKSTLLRVLSGSEEPVSGSVILNDNQLYSLERRFEKLATPIRLDKKPDCFNKKKITVLKCIEEKAYSDLITVEASRAIAIKFATLLSLSDEEMNGNPSSLSPSAQYIFGIACACVQSTAKTVYEKDDGEIELPCPIVLLDEMLDFETSIVATRVGKSLRELSRAGAIIISATHRPQHLKRFADRMITLSSGKVLINEPL
jgi:ABC-type cobalamin/Fe3+-siderophores transport system ATPase subunit